MLLTFLLLAHTLAQSSEKVSDDSFAYLKRVTATNACMKQIFVKLQDTLCDELTESDQSYIALELANCHLRRSGKPTQDCQAHENFSECTRVLKGDAWNTYTTFFTHVQQTCFWFRQEVWQENTSRLVTGLEITSYAVLDGLQTNLEQTEKIARQAQMAAVQTAEAFRVAQLTQATLEAQSTKQHELSENLNGLTAQVSKSHSEVRAIFTQVDSQLEKLYQYQTKLFGEFSDLSSLLWCVGICLVVVFLTSFTTTKPARAYCLPIPMVSLFVERCIDKTLVRNTCLLLIAVLLVRQRWTYIDYSRKSCEILEQVAGGNCQTPKWFRKYHSHYLRSEPKQKKKHFQEISTSDTSDSGALFLTPIQLRKSFYSGDKTI